MNLSDTESAGDEYSTKAIESRPDMWTAEISRTEQSSDGVRERASALVDVGLISYLLRVFNHAEPAR
jgi:hypothetical protein